MKSLKRFLLAPVFAAAAAGLTTGSSAAPPAQGLTDAVYMVTFASASDTFTFDISKAQGAGQLIVDTRDCCIAGDKWKIVVDPNLPHAAIKDATGTGDGSTTLYSGGAATMPFVAGAVTLSYDSGVDVWPASLEIRFAYENAKSTGMNITPPAAAVLLSSAP